MNPKSRSFGRDTSIPIGDVADYVNKEVNLLGIVIDFSLHRKSNGTDFVSTLKILDQSPQCPLLSVNIFTSRVEQLPLVKSQGDLIVLHKVKIDKYGDGAVNAIFKKKVSSFGLFEGSRANDICYQALGRFSLSSFERNILINLRNWWPQAHIDSGSNDFLISIKNIKEDNNFDLVCQVLHVSYDVSRSVWVLFVWDGTDAPMLTIDQKLKDEEKDPLPLHVEANSLGYNTICNFHRVGTVLRVMADQCHTHLDLQFREFGKWVRIRNISFKVLAGMWYGTLDACSRVRFLADNDGIVVNYKREFEERKSERDRLPLGSVDHSLTEIQHDDSIRFATLMDVLCCKEANCLFYCVVRVVAVHPFQTNALCSSVNGENPMMRMTLEDPTTRIHAILLGEDLVKFMNDFPSDVIKRKMKVVLGIPEHQDDLEDCDLPRFPALIKCCISTANDGNGFYIRHTRLA